MAEPFVGEIRSFPFGVVPRGWAPCDGQLLSINSNQALFSLIGTFYGGNGTNNFALPNLRGRASLHTSSQIPIGAASGAETHALTINEMPMHNHQVQASSDPASLVSPQGNVWAEAPNLYGTTTDPITTMSPQAIGHAGQSQPHSNMQPYLTFNFCIAITGIYPPRN